MYCGQGMHDLNVASFVRVLISPTRFVLKGFRTAQVFLVMAMAHCVSPMMERDFGL